MKIKILILLVFGILYSCKNEESNRLPAAGNDDAAYETNNPDGNWELFKVNDTAFSIEKVYSLNYGGQPRIQIDMAKNKIGGFTGCNNWGTSLSIRNNSLVLEDPIESMNRGVVEPGSLNS